MIQCGGTNFDLSKRCLVMGVLNVTPDSHSDGGEFLTADTAIAKAMDLFEAGADIVDIGGESTNPFHSQPITCDEEIRRVLPVVRTLVKKGFTRLSIDTRNAGTARVCLGEGVPWLNDVSALSYDPLMIHEAKKAEAVILMHARGTPQTMQKGEIHYDDVAKEVAAYLRERVVFCEGHGISRSKLILDPGFGFGKRLEHNIALVRALGEFKGIAAGILSGVGRKHFLGEIAGIKKPSERDSATLGAVAHSVLMGANIVRVYNVKATREMLTVFERLLKG